MNDDRSNAPNRTMKCGVENCELPCRNQKPFCVDHYHLLGNVSKISATYDLMMIEIATMKETVKRLNGKAWREVKVDSLVSNDIVSIIRGMTEVECEPLTLEALCKHANMKRKVVACYIDALVAAAIIKRARIKRGRRRVNVLVPAGCKLE